MKGLFGRAGRVRSLGIAGAVSSIVLTVALPLGASAGAEESSLKGSSVGSSVVTRPVVQPGDIDTFYDTSNVTPTRVGEILRTQQAPYSGIFGDSTWAVPKSVQKIMYTTQNTAGVLTPVTGYVLEPTVPWRGDGPRPTLVIVRGTVGQGDHCAPSRNWPLDGQPDPVYSGRFVNLEGLYDMMFANQGVRVVVTDLIGMGTPGMHTYMNRDDQAHAMLDAARAARGLVEARGETFGAVALYGHSQGGGASSAAAEAQPAYAPDINLVAAYASAPPADLDAVQRNIDGSDLVGAIGFTINGLLARFPNLEPIIAASVTDEGSRVLENVAQMCTDDIMNEYGGTTTRQWITGGRSLTELAQEHPEAKAAMDAQLIGTGKPNVPVMIVSGRFDRNVAYGQAKHLAQNWCAKGVPVLYRDDFLPEIGTLGEYNHVAQSVSGATFGMPFIVDAFHGRTPQETAVCTNWNGNAGSSEADASSAMSSLPMSSGLVMPGSSQGGSSGREGSFVL
ncbi:lipase family protein [Corynebacterium qintianiae]|uniref:lipase family protein n=1 Tax=Corynebacterium qintianiae TaxID=2709392 RepID=UPI0013EBCFC7|nr:lipase family protein [Corynebacterium qintianiae]